VLAAAAAAAFGLSGHPPAAARASRNKLEAHRLMAAAGLPVTPFEALPVAADPRAVSGRLRYPVVIKPLALSGSRGVIRADTPDAFVTAFHRLRRILASPDVRTEHDEAHDRVLVESFIPGAEYAVEGLLDRGRFLPFAIFEKPDPMDGPFFEETIYVTPPRLAAPAQQDLLAAVARAAAALGLWHGPVHAECRRHVSGVFVLEVAARPIGGLCSRALRFEDGASLEEVLLRHAVGQDVASVRRERRAAGVMMIPIPARGILRRVEGEAAAAAVPGVEAIHVTAKRDALLVPLPEGRSYLGFIFARGDTADDVERALRDAHARLAFTIERAIPVLAGPEGLAAG
jgi:biotin carboxylase